MAKNMNFPKLHNFNDMYTPESAINYIAQYLPKNKTYWEACYGKGHMAKVLSDKGFSVVGNENIDCLLEQPEAWDIWITNPPFNGNKKFIARAIELGKPFVFLIRLEHLGGVSACKLLKDLDFTVIIPEKRINYITPKMLEGQKVGGSPFHSVFLCHGIGTPKGIIYQPEEGE